MSYIKSLYAKIPSSYKYVIYSAGVAAAGNYGGPIGAKAGGYVLLAIGKYLSGQ